MSPPASCCRDRGTDRRSQSSARGYSHQQQQEEQPEYRAVKGSEFACRTERQRLPVEGSLSLITQPDERRDQAMNECMCGVSGSRTAKHREKVIIIRAEERHAIIKHVYRERKSPAVDCFFPSSKVSGRRTPTRLLIPSWTRPSGTSIKQVRACLPVHGVERSYESMIGRVIHFCASDRTATLESVI